MISFFVLDFHAIDMALCRTGQNGAPLFMNIKLTNRQCLFIAVIAFYLVPLLFFSGYSIRLMSHQKSWTLLSLGLLLISFASLSLLYLLFYWEQSLRDKKKEENNEASFASSLNAAFEKQGKITALDHSFLDQSQNFPEPIFAMQPDKGEEASQKRGFSLVNLDRESELLSHLKLKDESIEKLGEEIRQLTMRMNQSVQDLADYKLFSEEQLKQKQLQLAAAMQVIDSQKSEMEKRLTQIQQLDGKIHDLSYEIKTLLRLNEIEVVQNQPKKSKKEELYCLDTTASGSDESEAVPLKIDLKNSQATGIEPGKLLKKCIDAAQKLTGSNYYGGEASRYREFPSSYFAIDQKRLFESLQAETGALLIVYSQKEQKLLFVSDMVKGLLGWSPERFVLDFPKIIGEGIFEWKRILQSISLAQEAEIRLLAKTSQGGEVLLSCNLGVIPSGLFRGYVIASLVPA